jgi:hypothetical protein
MKIGAVILNRTKWIELWQDKNLTDNNKFWMLNLIMLANWGGKDSYGNAARGRIIASVSGEKGICAAIRYRMYDDDINNQVIYKHLNKLKEHNYIKVSTDTDLPYVEIVNYDDWSSQ